MQVQTRLCTNLKGNHCTHYLFSRFVALSFFFKLLICTVTNTLKRMRSDFLFLSSSRSRLVTISATKRVRRQRFISRIFINTFLMFK